MNRVLSIQTSRWAFNDEEEFVTKRFCCSFVFALSFMAIIGGFLLGRFSTYRDFEIKKSDLDTERHNLYGKHLAYLNSLNLFSEALSNLTKSEELLNADASNAAMNAANVLNLWSILACREMNNVQLIKSDAGETDAGGGDSKNNSSKFKQSVEQFLKTYVETLTKCIQQGEHFIVQKYKQLTSNDSITSDSN